ncbi:UDP-N-acetylmuramoylalanine--D-glutamate ligase [Candidatus Koribacter versatilis Ellin345]|uniref:UDP-N-acetylmuramoylalanine--D-glutamate ligase n=1 Tax=Koribacter versatilis (strain Ellin345) TaxID=204669 RepID=MURD_KORVE|nr:UDP-N-acetylmuramoyl-L-alanine--D-glutamate ligase [Candidatus Koribacter versatilis]Q1IKG8.1 RecName: Full=UDP-N-acetylmuramoylalanine--D-glutamate ligase; AltName: Full=D-glutamic acid-adding enzyme; AltName: Full=UDP-N-acetylmuramoyl-L-alanyl-D-glutamate synthetase [Candidatus Koribacter versatilis Ellin345]ABF42632.1 UDP-N-acetylmuramoylalanine--D-glutamate ligase [Candidatus Koribacter versatilis Ellin345]
MDVRGKRVLVVGLGKSGIASATFLQAQGAKVTVSDSKSEAQLRQEIPLLLDKGITVETGHHGERTFRDQDLIVISPGVPFDQPQLEQARKQGIPVIGEIELAAQFVPGHVIAITGSNGKTTTTSLCGDILQSGGKKTLVGGNIGTPAISFAQLANDDTWSVLEISSFQLETIERFRPEIAAILNITPDHLDRHGTFEKYAAAKERIFENQREHDFAILNADNEPCVEIAKRVKSQVLWFSRQHEVKHGTFVREDKIYFRDPKGEREIMPVADMLLKGAHNVENVLAAVCVGVAASVAPEQIRKAVSQFKAVEHRLEYTATVKGVDYYNDSKATNVDATIKALESFSKGVHLILGGKDKGSPYTVLNDLLHERAKTVYTIGAAAAKIEAEVKGVEVVHAETLENAVKLASQKAVKGDVVLLAPACASFDQFQSYEHRGRIFKELVRKMAEQEKK